MEKVPDKLVLGQLRQFPPAKWIRDATRIPSTSQGVEHKYEAATEYAVQ